MRATVGTSKSHRVRAAAPGFFLNHVIVNKGVKYMRRACTCILLLTLICCAATSRAKGPSSDIDRVLNRFPGYHVLTLMERNSDARTFIKGHFPKHNPSVVHSDFDGDGHPDYALLIKDGKSGTTKLVVLLCSGDTRCKNVFDVDVTSSSGEVFIRPVPIGSNVSQTEAMDTKDYPSPVKLSSTGIELTYFGQAKVVYYWNMKNKKVEAVQTED